MQFILNENYSYNLSVDGIFGNATLSAVRDFQNSNSLTVDGLVGNNTWKTLLSLPPYPLLRQGDSGAYVKLLQQLLESKLIAVNGIDGIFGSKTLAAVRLFQQEKGLDVDGLVGNNTWSALVER